MILARLVLGFSDSSVGGSSDSGGSGSASSGVSEGLFGGSVAGGDGVAVDERRALQVDDWVDGSFRGRRGGRPGGRRGVFTRVGADDCSSERDLRKRTWEERINQSLGKRDLKWEQGKRDF